jgi:hypothetical protein
VTQDQPKAITGTIGPATFTYIPPPDWRMVEREFSEFLVADHANSNAMMWLEILKASRGIEKYAELLRRDHAKNGDTITAEGRFETSQGHAGIRFFTHCRDDDGDLVKTLFYGILIKGTTIILGFSCMSRDDLDEISAEIDSAVADIHIVLNKSERQPMEINPDRMEMFSIKDVAREDDDFFKLDFSGTHRLDVSSNLFALRCLKCQAFIVLTPCDNCSSTSYRPAYSNGQLGIFCMECKRGITRWECRDCGADNPISLKTVWKSFSIAGKAREMLGCTGVIFIALVIFALFKSC